LQYNINGFFNKLLDKEWFNYIEQFDIVSLVETHLDINVDVVDLFTSFKIFYRPAIKLSTQGRRSGGVMVLVKKCLCDLVQEVDVNYCNIIVLKLDKELLVCDADVLYIAAYIPPTGSPFYALDDTYSYITELDSCVEDLFEKYGDLRMILCGDLNARIADIQIFHSALDTEDETFDNSCIFVNERVSQDAELNAFGKLLLEFCWCHNLQVINGNPDYDTKGQFTYMSSHGHSVVDYFIVSNDLLFKVHSLAVQEHIFSDHMPVAMYCKRCTHENNRVVPQEDTVGIKFTVEKYTWCPLKVDIIKEKLLSNEFRLKVNEAEVTLNTNIDYAVDKFTGALLETASCMKKRITHSSKKVVYNAKWFDKECWKQKKKVKALLGTFRQNRTSVSFSRYEEERKVYKEMIKEKKKESQRNDVEQLVKSANNCQEFWGEIRKHKKKKIQTNNIMNTAWVQHFKEVFCGGVNGVNMGDTDIDLDDNADENTCEPLLDAEITEREVSDAIRKLKAGKAPGPDNILAELLKTGENEIIIFLTKLFNTMLKESKFPVEWTKAIIIPLHKKGNIENPDNYRGISLLSILSKVFTGIINQRLNKWAEANDILSEAQAGFRKGRSTVDHIFTLNALIEKQFSRNMKLYVAFIDFRKAYDMVNRNILYTVLFRAGIKGKMLELIKAIYNTVKACVKGSNGTTEYFDCLQGLKQGCTLSPILFSILINELANDIINNGRHGMSLGAAEIDLFLLLFADDLTLLASTIVGLQNQLNYLQASASRLGLVVNLEKSQIVVFRKGGYLAAKEKWSIGSNKLKVVNAYKYLGLLFSSRLSFSGAIDEMAARGKKSTLEILRTLRRIGCVSADVFFKLFDTQVVPVLLYAAEIWGYKRFSKVEQIHLYACKRFLRITDKTPNDIIYGELGRFPLWIVSGIKCIKFWLRLLQQPDSMYSKKSYIMLAELDRKGTTTWVTQIRNLLCYYGFELVWLFGCGNKAAFCQALRERMVSDFYHEWRMHIDSSGKLKTYGKHKDVFGREKYIDIVTVEVFRRGIIQLRAGVSQIFTHKFRFRNDNSLKCCPFCKSKLESVEHFLFYCPNYASIRHKYLSFVCNMNDNDEKFKKVMTADKDADIFDTARFIKYAFTKRTSDLKMM
jgi:hypothetical protein